MNTKVHKINSAIVSFVTMLTAQAALAYYNPSTGTWLSRDPVGEPGFQLVQGAHVASQVMLVPAADQSSRWIKRDPPPGHVANKTELPSGPNLYAILGNDSVDKIDLFGLITFEGCSTEHQEKLSAAWNSVCQMANNPKFQCCVHRPNLIELYKRRCGMGNVKFKCLPDSDQECTGLCAFTRQPFPYGHAVVYVCNKLWTSPNCDWPPFCVIAHELAHIFSGSGERGTVGEVTGCCWSYSYNKW